jgi:hypothetical protein
MKPAKRNQNTSLQTAPDPVDFSLQNEGTIFLLRPLSPAARTWTDDHLPADATRFGPSIVVEHRYISDIVNGAQDDGLTFQAASS